MCVCVGEGYYFQEDDTGQQIDTIIYSDIGVMYLVVVPELEVGSLVYECGFK